MKNKTTPRKVAHCSKFDQLFTKHYKMLCASAYFLLKDEQAAKDIVQSLFIDVWEKKIYLRMDKDAKAYLFRSVQNRCLNYLRAIETDRGKQRDLIELHAAMQGGSGSGNRYTENTYLALSEAIGELPEQRKRAVHLVYLSGKRYQDAADSMGISINSLKTHLKVGIRNLREKLSARQ